MNLVQAVYVALITGVLLLATTIGLRASLSDVTALLRQPRQLIPSIFSMLIVMPIVAIVFVRQFGLAQPVEIAMVALALSPVPPVLPAKSRKVGGDASYAAGLLVSTCLIATLFVPLALSVLARVFDLPLTISIARVALPVSYSVLAPVSLGLLLRRFAPRFAERATQPLARISLALLVGGLIPVYFMFGPEVISLLGNGTLLAMVAFCVLGLCAGHLLGGPGRGRKMALALATASRHPGVAMAVARSTYPNQSLVFPAILLYVLVNLFVSLAYTKTFRPPSA